MSQRAAVWIATTKEEVACALRNILGERCSELGLHLRAGASERPVFSNADDLFDTLSAADQVELLDTLLVLDLGTHLNNEVFETRTGAAASGRPQCPWHRASTRRIGFALELTLRFPQLQVAFYSPYCPGDDLLERWLSATEPRNLREHVSKMSVSPAGPLSHFVSDPEHLSTLVDRFAGGFRTVFDPTGFRTILRNYFIANVFGAADRERTQQWENTQNVRGTFSRYLRNLAVLVDDEVDIAMLAGYVGYKFGFRSFLVTTYNEYGEGYWRSALACVGADRTINADPALQVPRFRIIRDVDLRFPDFPDGGESPRKALKDVYDSQWRDRLLSLWGTNLDWRVRVLSQDRGVRQSFRSGWWIGMKSDTEEASQVGQFRSEPRKEPMRVPNDQKYLGVRKPLPSIHSANVLFDGDEGTLAPVLAEIATPTDPEVPQGHGAPYVNLTIASDLIDRAWKCRKLGTARAGILAALFGHEAYMLLLGMSKTSALAALREVHLAEAQIEGASLGVGMELRIGPRRKELEATVRKLDVGWADSVYLAQLWAELRLVYKEGDLFEASEQANRESLANQTWLLSRGFLYRWFADVEYFTPLRPGLLVFKRMLLVLSTSMMGLLALFLMVTFVLTGLYSITDSNWAHLELSQRGLERFLDLFTGVVIAELRSESLDLNMVRGFAPTGWFYSVLDFVCAFTSLFFVGLLVAILYRKTTRG